MRVNKELKEVEVKKLQEILFEKCGYKIKFTLLKQAFTRKSYSTTNYCENNETLEFLGDRVLDVIVVKRLIGKFYNINNNGEFTMYTNEGKLTNLKNLIVNNISLAGIIDEWDVIDYLMIGKSDADNQIEKQTKFKADLLEAIIGAITVQSKWDFDVLENVVCKILSLDDKIQEVSKQLYRNEECSLENAISTLKTIAERGECSFPEYKFYGPEDLGYDENGAPIWSCSCSVINNETGLGVNVFSKTKKDAKKAAAYLILCRHYKLFNEYGDTNNSLFWQFIDGILKPKNN